MRREVIECIEVLEADGFGISDNHFAYVSNQALADVLIKESKGYKSSKKFRKEFIIFDTREEMIKEDTKQLIASAKAKLTAAERKACGLE